MSRRIRPRQPIPGPGTEDNGRNLLQSAIEALVAGRKIRPVSVGVPGGNQGNVDLMERAIECNGAFSTLIDTRGHEPQVGRAATFEASPDPVITMDPWGHVLDFNSAAQEHFGYRRGEARGRRLVDLIVPPRLRQWIRSHLVDYQTTGDSALLGKRVPGHAMRSDGSEFPVEFVVMNITHAARPFLAVYVRNVTARERTHHKLARYQQRLRSLAAELLIAEERERRRLAADLHDGLSQTISLVQIKLSALRHPSDQELETTLDDIRGLIRDADRAARSITFELSPPVLHDLGLEPALQWLVENIQTRYGMEIELEDDGQPKPTDEKTRVILFRAIRELLINTAKHAGTSQARVRLERDEAWLTVTVEDHGVGMEQDGLARGTGLFSIRERLDHVGGDLRIESAPGRGTKVSLRTPTAAAEETP